MSGSSCPHVLQLTLAKQSEVAALPEWLDGLPNANTLCAHICLKGMSCTASHTKTALHKLKNMRIHSCVEEPGGHENGHEGVCAYRFLLDQYDKPWEGVFFLHGDVHTSHHGVQYRAFKEYLAKNEWPKWPSTRFEMRTEHCGCGHYASLFNPFGPRDFWHQVMTWWMGQFLMPRDPAARSQLDSWQSSASCSRGVCTRAGVGAWPLHGGTLNSPLGFMFAVDRASALQRSRRFLEAQYRMCKVGVRTLPPGQSGASRASWLPAPAFDYNPLVYGHVNERIPFFVFGHDFEEREVPDCVFEGDHASMNCTQPEVAAMSAGASPKGLGHATAGGVHAIGGNHSIHAHAHSHAHGTLNATALRAAAPRPPGACMPFDRSCGTTG